jgi:hypothetical protein
VKIYRYEDEERRELGQRLADGVIAGRAGIPEVAPESMRRRPEDTLPAWDVERIRAWREDYFASVRNDFAERVFGIADVTSEPPEQLRADQQ